MIVTTSICSNYLPKAMVLAKSLKEHNPESKMIVCLVEEEIPSFVDSFEYFDDIVLAKDLGFDNFKSYIFKHAIVEAATSVKGQLFRYLMKEYIQEEKFVYLDPDIKVYGEFVELNQYLDENEIVLTPHLADMEDHIDAVMDNELCALQHGVFNLGFLAVRRGAESKKFIDWWTERLGMFCYDAIPRGIFTDQKWIDLAPCFFDVKVLKHPGYNIAPWNLSKRHLDCVNGKYMVNGQPVIFFHFSGFDSGANEAMINKYVPALSNVVYKMRDIYVEEMNGMGQDKHGNYPWFYNTYDSGEKIENISRLIFRDKLELKFKYENPFNESNGVFFEEGNITNDSASNKEENSYYTRIHELENEIEVIKGSLRWRVADKLGRDFPVISRILRGMAVKIAKY